MSNASIDHIDQVLAYFNENGESKTLQHFGIAAETLRRYERKKKFTETKNPKILLLDIETSTITGRFWRLGKQRIGMEQIIDDWFIIGWCAKWLFEDEIKSDFLTPKEAIKRDDTRVVKSIWKLVNDADIILGHNLKRFDMPKLNSKFLLAKLPPPMPYQMIDTLAVAYKHFGFSSAKLDYLGQILCSKKKLHTDYDLWIRCEAGDADALEYMETYCKGDVDVLESVYIELRPWIRSHPNLAVLMDAKEPCCPNCGGFEFDEVEGQYVTPQNRYTAVRCSSCGAVNRKKASDITSDQRKVMLVPNAR